MTYCSKYHLGDEKVRFTFDHIYKYLLPSYKISANLYAACGEDLKTYLGYAAKVLRTPKARAVFVENNLEIFELLKKELARSKHPVAEKVEVVYDNIMHHEDIVAACKINKATRVEDYGLGIGVESLLRMLVPQLDRQRSLTSASNGKKLLKAQIFDADIGRTPTPHVVKALNWYLNVIGTKIVSINGHVNARHEPFMSGRVIKTYVDKKWPRQVQEIRKHVVQLVRNSRAPELHLYTYYNGNYMLTGVLIYR